MIQIKGFFRYQHAEAIHGSGFAVAASFTLLAAERFDKESLRDDTDDEGMVHRSRSRRRSVRIFARALCRLLDPARWSWLFVRPARIAAS